MFNKIKLNFSDGSGRKIFVFMTNGKSQLDLALRMTKSSKFNFVIYTNQSFDSVIDIKLNENTTICAEWRSIVAVLPAARGIITTVGHYSPVLSGQFKKILAAGASLNLPLIEVPHGLFQWGINITDDSKVLDLASSQFGAGTWYPSIADHQIRWYGESNSVGYPRYTDANILDKKSIVPDFIIITSNLNWYAYSDSCRRNFLNCVIKYALENPRELFIWCMHLAEKSTNIINDILVDTLPSNILTYGIDKDIYFNGIDCTEDLISYAKFGITTISTLILDYEISKIPLNIFSCEGTSAITNSFRECSTFSKNTEINRDAKVLDSGYLKPFDFEYFDFLLDEFSKFYTLENKDLKEFLKKEF